MPASAYIDQHLPEGAIEQPPKAASCWPFLHDLKAIQNNQQRHIPEQFLYLICRVASR